MTMDIIVAAAILLILAWLLLPLYVKRAARIWYQEARRHFHDVLRRGDKL